MGRVIALCKPCQTECKTRRDELMLMALREVPDDYPRRSRFEEAVRDVVQHPVNTDFDLTTDELDQVGYFLRLLAEEWTALKRQEALLVSLMRLKRETGWDLIEDPRINGLARRGPAVYLTYLHVIGAVALAWQVHVHPRDIILDQKMLARMSA